MTLATNEHGYGFGVTLHLPFDEAIERTKEALKAEGFGVLTTIDVRATMKEKLDRDFEPYVILGACNPQLAWRALEAEHDLGLLLPCNVIVHEHGGRSVVSAIDPMIMMGVAPGNAALAEVGAEAAGKLRKALEALGASAERGETR